MDGVIKNTRRTHDTVGRRFRDVTVSTGKRVIKQPEDIEWFEFIHRMGMQPAANIFRLTQDRKVNYTRALHRMRDLRHEDNSAYGGTMLHFPIRQTYTHRPDRNRIIYGLTPKAIEYLKRNGKYRKNAPTTNNYNLRHDVFGHSVMASIFFAARDLGLEFIFHDEIVDKLPTTTFDVTYPYKGSLRQVQIKPDGFCGVKYPSGDVRIFVREEDCGTERLRSDAKDVKSHQHTTLAYIALLSNRETKAKYFPGFPRVVVLNSFSRASRMASVIQLVEEITDGKGTNFMLYKAWEAFDEPWSPPAAEDRVFTEPWLRAGQPPLDITSV